MSSSKKLPGKGTLRLVSEAHNPPPPLNTVYGYTAYLFTKGREGDLNQREGERGNRGDHRSQTGLKYQHD